MAGPGSDLIGEEEKKAVLEVIEAGYLFRYGEKTNPNFKAKVWQLEEDFSRYCGTRHSIAVNSGSSALLVALSALGIGPGDEVIVPGYTFIASISSIIFARAIPILAEVDETLNLDPEDVRQKITPRTKAIMLVHMLGNPGRIDEIKKIADDHKLFLIEDCAQALGATYKGKPVGSYGQIGTFSFNFYKTITAGEGGMVTTSDEALYKRAFAIHDQGHLPLRRGIEEGNRAVLGYDFRMTELSAAIIQVQLKRIDDMKKKMHVNKQIMKNAIAGIPGVTFRELPDPQGELASLMVFYLPDAEVTKKVCADLNCSDLSESGWHVYNNMEQLLDKKTVTQEGCPFSCPYYTGGEVKYAKGMLPQTDKLLKRAINISIGVWDKGLGAAYGLKINSSPVEVEEKAETLYQTLRKYL
jgi:dTDP-4-amino-4,6-dideoxygalactose transaminase